MIYIYKEKNYFLFGAFKNKFLILPLALRFGDGGLTCLINLFNLSLAYFLNDYLILVCKDIVVKPSKKVLLLP